jgi:hypothetical protein
VLPERHAASPLPEKTRVKITRSQIDQKDGTKWSLVEVKSILPGFNNVTGWVKDEFIKANRIKSPAVLYVDTGWIPKHETPCHKAELLPAGIRMRRLETRQDWVLVCTLDKIITHGYVYAWLRKNDIKEN